MAPPPALPANGIERSQASHAESASPASSNPPTAGEVTLNDLPSKDSLVEQLGGEEQQVWQDYCLSHPPDDLETGPYNIQSVKLARHYQPVVDLVSSQKDIRGNPLSPMPLCLPYLLAARALIPAAAALNYCPKELESALQGEHSALARRSSGRLMSTAFEFVRLSCSSLFGLFAKIDMVPFKVDYGVEPSKFVSKEVYRKIMAAMRTFFLAAVSERILPLMLLLSKKTVKVFQEDILQMNDAQFAEFLKQDGANILQTADGKPHRFSHPERLLKYFTNRHKAECEEWDAGFDALFRRLNASDRCTTAIALHDNTQDHPAVQLAKERHADACKFGGEQSERQLVFADVMAAVDFDSKALSPDWKWEFGYWDLKFASQGRRGKLIEVLKSRLRGRDTCIALSKMSAALVRTAKPEEERFSDVVLRRLLSEKPELQAELNTLRAHYKDDDEIFKALADQHEGLDTCHALKEIPAALGRAAKPEEECFSSVVLHRLLREQPQLRPSWDTLRVHYKGTDAAFQALKAIREEKKLSGKLCTRCCWRRRQMCASGYCPHGLCQSCRSEELKAEKEKAGSSDQCSKEGCGRTRMMGAYGYLTHGMCGPCRKEERETEKRKERETPDPSRCSKDGCGRVRNVPHPKSHTLCPRCRSEELKAEKEKENRPAKRRRTSSDKSKPPDMQQAQPAQPRFQQIDVCYTTPSLGITVCIDPKTRHVAIRTIKPGAPHCCTLMVGDIVVGINGCQLPVYEVEAHTLKVVVEMLKTTRRPMVVNFYRRV